MYFLIVILLTRTWATLFPGSLSSTPLVDGRMILFVAGHVATKILDGKKSVGQEGGRVFWLLLWQALWIM